MGLPSVSRREFLAVSAGALLAAQQRGRSPFVRAAVPTWDEVHGVPLGITQASRRQIDDYVLRVAEASPRVVADVLSQPTVRGNPLRYAVISHPDNLARLDEIAARTRALRLRPPSAAEAARHARSEPAIVAVIANVHGNEPSGADASVRVLYELASREDEDNLRRLRELVVVMVPVQNPDGRDAARRVNANGFDCNRDWFAFTQPETRGKVELYSRLPPVVSLDVHEQFASAPDSYFFPPPNDPVHHEASRAGLDASDRVVTPAIERAFTARGWTFQHYGAYDLFYSGYGDCAPNQAFGAAGLTFEQENSDVYARKVDRQYTAVDATLSAVAAEKESGVRTWAEQWARASDDGARGALRGNLHSNPANPEPVAVPDERVYGYALRTARSAADAAHLVDRLRAFDVQVHVLRRPVRLAKLRPFGERAFGPAALPRGTILVRARQPLKGWVHALLADDPFPSMPYFYDVAGWSNPALMGLEGGAIGEPLEPLLRRPRRTRRQIARGRPLPVATASAVDRARDLAPKVLRPASAYAFPLDAALAQAAAFDLIARGIDVRRLRRASGAPAGAAVVAGSDRDAVLDAARRYGIRPRPLRTVPRDAEPAHRPRVALLRDPAAEAGELFFPSSAGYALWVLRSRFGLDVQPVRSADVDAGALDGDDVDVFVVPDGFTTAIPGRARDVSVAPPGGGMSAAGLDSVRRFVSRGGTFVGYRSLGVAVATGAGIAGDLATVAPPETFTVPGGPVRVALDGDSAAVRGLGASTFVFNESDPILTGGGETLARYPDELTKLCFAEGLEAVNGTVAGTAVATGRGTAYVFSFDPCFRGFVEATQRLVGNVLLAAGGPQAGAVEPSARRAGAPAPVVSAARHTLVRVAAADAPVLRAAVAALTAAPADLRLVTARDGALEARAVDPDPLSGHPAAWLRAVLAFLAERSVAPALVVG